MRSDEIKMPKLEVFPEDTCKGVRLFAYSSALSGKEGSASSSSGDTTKASYGFCEVPYVTVHGLRHTYASLLIASGTDPRTAASQLGHSSPSLTMNVYANPQDAAKRKAGDLMGKIIEGNY